MVWSCAVCTFDNRNDTILKCEICETHRREEQVSPTSTTNNSITSNRNNYVPSSKSVQSTLFGGVAKVPHKKQPITKPSKHATKQDIVQTKPPSTTSLHDSNHSNNNNDTSKNNLGIVSIQNTLDSSQISNYNNDIATIRNLSFTELKVRAKEIMKTIFGIQKLRNLQPVAITCALKRQSQIIVMATGGGKSLCYQLPAVVLGGTSIIISPLIALMKDQVQALIEKGIEACVISSNNGEKHNVDIIERLLGREITRPTTKKKQTKPSRTFKPITIVYVTPEQVQTSRFRDILKELNEKKQLTLFAVDEAHCLSSWGFDFRKSYMQLDYLRLQFPNVPLMACTATATPAVLKDIQKGLHLENCPCHVGSFDRPNIFYSVKYKESLDAMKQNGSMMDLVTFIKKQHERADNKQVPCSGIVYCHTRQETTEIAHTVQKQCGISCVAYHAGLKPIDRNQAQDDWINGNAKIAVATVAFGMGIDLKHVRYVVHWTMSKNIESFYQESGRAGRDGLPSYSVVYYSKDDATKFQYLLRSRKQQKSKNNNDHDNENQNDPNLARDLAALDEIVNYCIVPSCRRQRLLQHFGETKLKTTTSQKNGKEYGGCQETCDYCCNPQRVERLIEAAACAMSSHQQQQRYHNPTTTTTTLKRKYDDEIPSKPFSVNGLGITEPGFSLMEEEEDDDGMDCSKRNHNGRTKSSSTNPKEPTKNFAKASSILSKYEALECKQPGGGTTGFVRFKQKVNYTTTTTTSEKVADDRIRIPTHLIPKRTAAVAVDCEHTTNPTNTTTTSTDFGAEAERLRAKLIELKAAMRKP